MSHTSVVRPGAEELQTASDGYSPGVKTLARFVPEVLAGEKILIIDSHAPMIASFKDMLWRGGASNLYEANNYSTAIRLLREHHFALVICDFDLRGTRENGQSLLTDARRQRLLPYSTLFIMMTSEDTERMRFAALEESPDDYLAKPLRAVDLIDKITRMAQLRHYFKPAFDALDQHNDRRAIQWLQQHIRESSQRDHSKDSPFVEEAQRLLGHTLVEAAFYREAERHYRLMSERDYTTPWAVMGQGISNFFMGRLAQAKRCFAELLNQPLMSLEAYDWLARIHCLEEDFDLAQYAMELACVLSPLSLHKQSLLGHIAFLNRQYDVAERAFRSILYGHHHTGSRDSRTYRDILWGHRPHARLPDRNTRRGFKKLHKTLTQVLKGYPKHADLRIKALIIQAHEYWQRGDETLAQRLTDELMNFFLRLDLANQFSDEVLMKLHFKRLGRDFSSELQNRLDERHQASQEQLRGLEGSPRQRLERRLASRQALYHRQQGARQRLRQSRQRKSLFEQQYQDAKREVLHDLRIEAQRQTPREVHGKRLDFWSWEAAIEERYQWLLADSLHLSIEKRLNQKTQHMAAIAYLELLPAPGGEHLAPEIRRLIGNSIGTYRADQFEPAFFGLLRAIKAVQVPPALKLNLVQAGVSSCREGTLKEQQIVNICLFYLRQILPIQSELTPTERERFFTLVQALRVIDSRLDTEQVQLRPMTLQTARLFPELSLSAEFTDDERD
ncbi:response regulator [Pokkaliibacter sp. CJK22405]|uniref:response regulator n=1 Tax=Pokkaliibacter sp. CJK22405 TaxID=3384615 RepID=UPI003984F0E7